MAQQQQQMATQGQWQPGGTGARDIPGIAVRITGALLALAVGAVHVADQGGITVLAHPAWMGWGYRLIEVGAAVTALLLLAPRPAWLGPPWLGWSAGLLLGIGPLAGYLASRTVGVPGDPGDVGNWGYWVGTVSLFVEAALIVLSLTMLLTGTAAGRPPAATRLPVSARAGAGAPGRPGPGSGQNRAA